MAWFTRFTRFGDVHLVYGQEKNMSCGIASVMMCVFKINKLTPGKTALTVETDIYAKYQKAWGQTYTAIQADQFGTYPQHLATILGEFTGKTWRGRTVAPQAIPQLLIDKVGVRKGIGPSVSVSPVILGVDWDLGGAHWIVVDTIRSFAGNYYATVCDPWDTNVHIQKFSPGSAFKYHAGEGGFTIDFGGKHKGNASPYDNTSKGMVKTWGIICPD